MKLSIENDPLNVLKTTRIVVENAIFVKIDESNLNNISETILKKLKMGLDYYEKSFGTTGNFEDDIQLIFLEDVVNFCFWNEKGKEKWKIKWPKGQLVKGGYYNLIESFKRALSENIPILSSDYLADLELKDTKHLFRSATGGEIPLLEERQKNFNEAGRVLKKKFKGQFINALEEANYDAISLVSLIKDNFKSFKDISEYNRKKVIFLKRAQICVNDLSYATEKYKNNKLKNLKSLTAFADYRLPQIFREYNALTYKKELALKIDNIEIIESGSKEEIEIRAATIWAVELIRQQLEKYTSSEIDNALWLLSQDMPKSAKPHHRTYSIYY